MPRKGTKCRLDLAMGAPRRQVFASSPRPRLSMGWLLSDADETNYSNRLCIPTFHFSKTGLEVCSDYTCSLCGGKVPGCLRELAWPG